MVQRYAHHKHHPARSWRDPLSQVGSYGKINFDTGALDIEGNVYDPEFQTYVDECDGITIADYPPVYSEETVKASRNSIWTRTKEFSAPADACVASLPFGV